MIANKSESPARSHGNVKVNAGALIFDLYIDACGFHCFNCNLCNIGANGAKPRSQGRLATKRQNNLHRIHTRDNHIL